MNRLAHLVLALTVLAGCTGPATISSDTTSLPDVASAGLGALVPPTIRPDLTLGRGDGEPNIAIAPDGTMYVTPVSNLYRSLDGGKTFTDLGTEKTAGHGDGDTAVDETGRLHWLGLFSSTANIPYQHSDDRGMSFSQPHELSQTGSDREWIAAGPGGLGASWRDNDAGGIIAFQASHDHGDTWGERHTMSPDAVGGPLVAGLTSGAWYEAMSTFPAGPGGLPAGNGGAQVRLARTHDDGVTWNVTVVAEPDQSAQVGLVGFATSIFPVVALDDNGTVYVVFSADQRFLPQTVAKPASRFGIFLAVSKDDGATFSEPTLISNPDHAAIMPFIVAGAAGRAAVVWYENQNGAPNDALPDLWDVMLWESVTTDATPPVGVTAKLNGAANHVGPICTNGAACLVGDRCLLDFFEVALDGKGLPVATWSSCTGGTGIGFAAKATEVHFGGVLDGTRLR